MYSQKEEEKYILEACAKSERRQLLDIGAWDPKVFSNSRALIEAGWSAVLVEPSPMPLRNLIAEYANRADVQVIAAAVSICGAMMEMQITDDAVSTCDPAHAEIWKQRGAYIGRAHVPTVTLQQLMDRFGAYDFVNIDAEGISVDLLKVLLATEMFPRCICVEHDNRVIEAMQAARARGYHSVYENEENLVLSL